MSNSSTTEEILTQLEKRVDDYEMVPFGPEVQKVVEEVLNACPEPAKAGTTEDKIRIYLVRARAQLLLPQFVKEAEVDLNRALKFNQQNAPTWIALSEAYIRRNALKEARDALDSALRIEPKSIPALVKISQVIRFQTATLYAPNVESSIAGYTEAAEKAKEAVAVDPSRPESWAALALALFQQATCHNLDMGIAQKSLKAFNQAEAKQNPDKQNPDVYYNRAVVLKMFGDYEKAMTDFRRAYDLDPKGLTKAKVEADGIAQLLTKTAALMKKKYAGLGSAAAFKKSVGSKLKEGLQGNLNLVCLSDIRGGKLDYSSKTTAIWVQLKVFELISAPTEQPLIYHTVDKHGDQALVLVFRVLSNAINPNDVVSIPFPISSHTIVDTGVAEDEEEAGGGSDSAAANSGGGEGEKKKKTVKASVIVIEPRMILVNGSDIPRRLFATPSVSSRLFQ